MPSEIEKPLADQGAYKDLQSCVLLQICAELVRQEIVHFAMMPEKPTAAEGSKEEPSHTQMRRLSLT